MGSKVRHLDLLDGQLLFVITNSGARLIAIYESRLKAWDAVMSRKHTVFKVYIIKKDFSDILILGKLDSTMKNEKSFEMEFAAQVLFANPKSKNPVTTSYKIWAVSMAQSCFAHLLIIRVYSGSSDCLDRSQRRLNIILGIKGPSFRVTESDPKSAAVKLFSG